MGPGLGCGWDECSDLGWLHGQSGVVRAQGSRASLRDCWGEGACRGSLPRNPKFQHPHPQRGLSRGQPRGGGIPVQRQQWPCSQPPLLPSGPTCAQPPPSQPPATSPRSPARPTTWTAPGHAARRALRAARTAQHGRSSLPRRLLRLTPLAATGSASASRSWPLGTRRAAALGQPTVGQGRLVCGQVYLGYPSGTWARLRTLDLSPLLSTRPAHQTYLGW